MHIFLLDLTSYINNKMARIGIEGQKPFQIIDRIRWHYFWFVETRNAYHAWQKENFP